MTDNDNSLRGRQTKSVGEIQEVIEEWEEIRVRAAENGQWDIVPQANAVIDTLRWVIE